jgi:regulatory protein YycI of two-component signal transduction system YycFG
MSEKQIDIIFSKLNKLSSDAVGKSVFFTTIFAVSVAILGTFLTVQYTQSQMLLAVQNRQHATFMEIRNQDSVALTAYKIKTDSSIFEVVKKQLELEGQQKMFDRIQISINEELTDHVHPK